MANSADIDIADEYVSIINAAILKLELAADSGIALVDRKREQAAVIVSITGTASSNVAFAVDAAHIDPKSPFSGELGVMLEKIIASIKIDTEKTENGENSGPCIMLAAASPAEVNLPEFKGRIIVAFGDSATGALCEAGARPVTGRFIQKGRIKIMPTHGLVELSESPDLKKETWAHLKAVMAELAK